jgi:hypothetical protein
MHIQHGSPLLVTHLVYHTIPRVACRPAHTHSVLLSLDLHYHYQHTLVLSNRLGVRVRWSCQQAAAASPATE